MSDIALQTNPETCEIDIAFQGDDLLLDDGLETAALISIFTDQRVSVEELPDLINDRRGWWGDMFSDVDKDEIGSKLWLFNRSKTTIQTGQNLQQAAENALQWFIDDGLSQNITVTFSVRSSQRIDINIEIERKTGEDQKFNLIWEGQALRRG